MSRPAPAGRALGTSASGVLSTLTVILIQDDPCTDNWKLDFWKSSICLKENRCYLLPPDKDNENKSANNRFGVMVLMLISNCWDTSHGKFLCGFGGVITHGPHQDAGLERTLAATLPGFRKCSGQNTLLEEDLLFFTVLSQDRPQICALKILHKEPGGSPHA